MTSANSDDPPQLRALDAIVVVGALATLTLIYIAVGARFGFVGDEGELPLVLATFGALLAGVIGIAVALSGVDLVARWQWRAELVISGLAVIAGVLGGSVFFW
jgi:hypothetical protein